MAINFKNTQGKTYYIGTKLTKKGNRSYFMTRKESDKCLDEIPSDYEVFERYDSGMMFIRKKKEISFAATEITLIEQELKKNKSVFDYKLDVHGNLIKIYTVEEEKTLLIFKRFEERMRVYKKNNQIELQRYCYRGSVDDWMTVDYGEDFAAIAKRNLQHLGKESYYDLM